MCLKPLSSSRDLLRFHRDLFGSDLLSRFAPNREFLGTGGEGEGERLSRSFCNHCMKLALGGECTSSIKAPPFQGNVDRRGGSVGGVRSGSPMCTCRMRWCRFSRASRVRRMISCRGFRRWGRATTSARYSVTCSRAPWTINEEDKLAFQ